MANPDEETNESLLEILAKMESYFHGTSSGMDPMVSYTQQALYKDDQGQFQTIQDPGWPEDYKVYLLDSGVARETGPLVNQYKQLLENEENKLLVERELIPMVEHALHFYLNGSAHMLEECLSVISHFQRTYFEALIPDQVKTQWDEITAMDGVYLKFCGAGGGGYFFVISTGKELELENGMLIRIH
jgi:mevalonate kinase